MGKLLEFYPFLYRLTFVVDAVERGDDVGEFLLTVIVWETIEGLWGDGNNLRGIAGVDLLTLGETIDYVFHCLTSPVLGFRGCPEENITVLSPYGLHLTHLLGSLIGNERHLRLKGGESPVVVAK